MAERTLTKPEIASQKRVIKLPPAIGDWTTYRPPKVLVKKVKSGLYGFDRLSKKEVNQALLIHYRFVEELLRHLKIDLGLAVEFLSCQIEQTTYLNFLRTLSEPAAQGKLAIAGLHEAIQVFFGLNLANSIVNHALGSRDLEPLNRGLTEAEIATLTTTLFEYLPHYAAAFENIFPTPAFSFIGSPDAAADPSVNPSSTFIFFSADVTLNENYPGRIIFGFPGSSLKTLLKTFGEKEQARPLNFSRLASAALNNIMVPASAILGSTSLLTSDLHELEEGDVVSLDATTSTPIKLAIGDYLKLLAQPGLANRRKAIRIAGFRSEEEITVAPPLEIVEEQAPAAPVTAEPPPTEVKEEFPAEDLAEEEFTEEEFPEDEFKEEDFAEELGDENELKEGGF